MIYTPEEKQRMDRLLEVFADYLANSTEIDVAYAKKTGYVELVIAENADYVYFPIENYDDMLQMFFYHVLCDEVKVACDRDPHLRNNTMDYKVPFERLCCILAPLGEAGTYERGELIKFIAHWKKQRQLP